MYGGLFNEQRITSLSAAAVSADEYVLTHKTVFTSVSTEKTSTCRTTWPDLKLSALILTSDNTFGGSGASQTLSPKASA